MLICVNLQIAGAPPILKSAGRFLDWQCAVDEHPHSVVSLDERSRSAYASVQSDTDRQKEEAQNQR